MMPSLTVGLLTRRGFDELRPHKTKAKLGLAETLFYFKQICDGLSHAHACGVIHRDPKARQLVSLPSPADSETWARECLKILKRANADEVVHRYGSVTEFWGELAALATFDPAATQALPFKRPTPEDSELAKKRAELSPLAAILDLMCQKPDREGGPLAP